jgi:hypothetical protein
MDPVDLNGPAAIPMPVTIGKSSDFEPIFVFLVQNTTIDEDDKTGTLGLERHGTTLYWSSTEEQSTRTAVLIYARKL